MVRKLCLKLERKETKTAISPLLNLIISFPFFLLAPLLLAQSTVGFRNHNQTNNCHYLKFYSF